MATGKALADMFVRIGADISDFQKKTEMLTRQMNRVGENLQSIGKKLTIGVTLPIIAVGTAAINMAMDAVESENLFEVSMGNMAGAAREWSEKLRKELGLNAFEVRKSVATFNQMLSSMGLAEDQAFDMAKGLTQLSYDMASFFNLRPEEAFEKLQAGITGEIEPLKRLGIIINETTIKAFALKNGIGDASGELTEQEKILARYLLIMEQTKNAQGDLARTIDSPTNQLRIMRSQIENLAIDLGMVLLPIFSKFLKDVVKPFLEFLRNSVEKFKQLNPETQTTIIRLTALTAALGPLATAMGIFLTVLTPTAIKLAAIGAAIVGLVMLVGLGDDLMALVNQLFDLAGGFGRVEEKSAGAEENIKEVTLGIKRMQAQADKTSLALVRFADDVENRGEIGMKKIKRLAEQTVVTTNELIRTSVQGVANAVKSIWMGTTTTFKQAWQNALNHFVDIMAEMVVQAQVAGTNISVSMAAASAGVTLLVGMLASVFGGKGSAGGKSKLRQATEDFLAEIKRTLEAFENDVLTTLENLLRVTGKGREALANLRQSISDLVTATPSRDLRRSRDDQRELDRMRQQIIDNAEILKNAIMDEFRLKRDLILQTMELLKREASFAKDINQSITDVTRANFTDQELFQAQLGDIKSLQRLVGQATGEDKIALLGDLQQAFLAAWSTAQDLFGEDPAELARWQEFVISGLEDIKESGMTEFDRLIQINLDALDLGQRQLDTQRQLETHLAAIEDATRNSLAILADIVGGNMLGNAQVRDLEAQLNVLGFANGAIATGPTLGMFGEAGPEAVIPLDRLDSMTGGGSQTIIIQLDGRTIARKTVEHMPSVLRLQGVPV